MTPLVTFVSDHIDISPWADEALDRSGYDPRSPYVERFWLGILGPSTTWLMRRLAAGFDATPDGFQLDLGETARAIGLGDKGGRNSPFLRTLNRAIQFDLALVTGPSSLAARRRLPTLSPRHLARLSPALQDAHAAWEKQRLLEPPSEAQTRRSRQLALSLLELGEDEEEVERQLLRWRYHPTLARESALWAAERHVAVAADAG
jgi:hypothetical protein